VYIFILGQFFQECVESWMVMKYVVVWCNTYMGCMDCVAKRLTLVTDVMEADELSAQVFRILFQDVCCKILVIPFE